MKILLVEDNVSLCRNIASVLQNEGARDIIGSTKKNYDN